MLKVWQETRHCILLVWNLKQTIRFVLPFNFRLILYRFWRNYTYCNSMHFLIYSISSNIINHATLNSRWNKGHLVLWLCCVLMRAWMFIVAFCSVVIAVFVCFVWFLFCCVVMSCVVLCLHLLCWFTKNGFAHIKRKRFTKSSIPSRGLRSHNSVLVEFQVPPHPLKSEPNKWTLQERSENTLMELNRT